MTSPFARAPGVAFTCAGDPPGGGGAPRVYVALLPSGPLVVLEGPAAAVWFAATEDGPERSRAGSPAELEVVTRVVDDTALELEEIREDVTNLLTDLVGRGLLVPRGTFP